MKALLSGLGAVILACGCSAEAGDVSGYTIDFPSAAAAVAADRVLIAAYLDEGEDTCFRLVQQRRGSGALPEGAAASAVTSPCELATEPARAGLPLAADRYALFAVAMQGDRDLLVGCTVVSRAAAAPPRVQLTPVRPAEPLVATPCANS